ncbi:hypothetical protein [Caballeronia arvi]|uniref:hypothetical protein n=1 Tax=Caballeronia arvi TaxID=1777135 RepID=UPI0007722D37|nr:hypothetical protein [Caballeronia arvi]
MGYLIVLCVGMLAGMLSGAIWHSLINDVAARHRQFPSSQFVAIMRNFGKVLSWWREIDWKA